ncbi:hypothetical protein [Alkalibacillus silvisoli]|uniref:Uncharacterized protein n=1 Tax=Alkalibacillus silvisoli TaxID=392823 RepID=A0ABN1AAJ2_9BACI
MDPVWFFAIATIIVVVGIVIAFGQSMNQLENQLNQGEVTRDFTQKLTTRFMVKVAVIEIIPIILIIVGFMHLEEGDGSQGAIIPLAVALLVFIVGLIRLFSSREILQHPNIDKETTAYFQTTQKTAMMLSAAFPVIAFVAFMM